MDWLGLSNDHKLLRDDIAEFAKKELEEELLEFDKGYTFFDSAWKKAGQLGLFGFLLPEAVGGVEMDVLTLAVCLEELAVVSPSFAFAVAAQNVGGYAIQEFSNLGNNAEVLHGILKGNKIAICLESICKLTCNDERTKISGTSGFAVNGEEAKYLLMFASCKERNSWLNLEVDDKCEFMKEDEIIGMHCAGIGKFRIDSSDISDENFFQADRGEIDLLFRICLSAISTGICHGCYNVAVPYSKERVQFGRPISKFGMVRRMVSEIEESKRISRLLTYDAAVKFGSADHIAGHTASIVARNGAMISGDKAVQILGGAGYTRDYPAEMFFRDAKTLEVLLGVPDEERELIAKLVTE